MALYDNGTMDGNDSLEATEQALLERREYLKARALLAAKQAGVFAPPPAAEETGGWTSSTGQRMPGTVLKTPAAANLNPILNTVGDQFARERLTRDTTDYKAREAQLAQAAIDSTPRARAATPGIAPSTPFDDDGNPMPIPQEATPAYEPTPQDRVAWATKNQGIPSLRSTLQAVISDSLVKEPERIEARAERKHEKDLTRAEAQRKQAEELAYRRWRDEQNDQMRRDIAADNNDMRRDIAASIRAHAAANGGGDKASDYQLIQDPATGTVYRVGKKPGSPMEKVEGVTGNTGADVRKDSNETRDAIERSELAISEASRVKQLLKQGSASGLKADARKVGSYVAPALIGGEALKADEALKSISDTYVKSVPRFSGPTSDGDRKDYAAAAGRLADTNIPPQVRTAALEEVVRLHKKALVQMRERSAPPSVRESVKEAVRQQQGGWAVERRQ